MRVDEPGKKLPKLVSGFFDKLDPDDHQRLATKLAREQRG
jgi:hypothetical protein